MLFLYADYTVTGKWKNNNLSALKSRKHVCREDWHFGVQIEKEVFDEYINSLTRLFFFFNIEISSSVRAMFRFFL